MRGLRAAATVVAVFGVAWAQAATIPVENISVTASSSYGATPVENLLNPNLNNNWNHGGNAANEGPKDDTPWVLFTFDEAYDIAGVSIWNYGNQNTGRGARHVSIFTSTDNVNFTLVDTIEVERAAPEWWTVTPDEQQFFFDEAVTAKYVKFVFLDNWYGTEFYQGTSFENGWMGQSAVAMTRVDFQQIPEPATMSLLALGGLALLRRRK